MTQLRLELSSPELVGQLRIVLPHDQLNARIAAIEFAIDSSGLKDAFASEAFRAIRESKPVLSATIRHLEGLLADLDRTYFELQEKHEGSKENEEILGYFSKARTVAAILAAFDKNTFEASAETIYEASMTTDDPVALFSRIEMTLKEVDRCTRKTVHEFGGRLDID